MSAEHGPKHRQGKPGGPGCSVTPLDVTVKGDDGVGIPAQLLDAGRGASEVELLRTVARGLGVRWGHDDFGWWAVVPSGSPK
jgi:hypothetical protein